MSESSANQALIPGELREIAPAVKRLIAPNGGPMTGPGTNTYLFGEHELAVLDPGPADHDHLARIEAACAGRCRWILTTHTHPDHSPGAAPLARATGATLIGLAAPRHGPQDRTFRPDVEPADGWRLATGEFTLRAVHTPGHASNHVCWLLEGQRMLFTGDHVMGGSTVVIGPPDGNMNAYLASLERLKTLGLAALAPGHGPVLDAPDDVVDALVHHRLGREAKVVAAIDAHPGATRDTLLPVVYADTPAHLHALAAQSLQAHLDRLVENGRARAEDGRYTLARG